MKRIVLNILLGVAVVMSLAACGSSKEKEAITLVYAEMNPLDTIAGETAVAFKEKVEELSKGSIRIDIQHSGVLGDETTIVEAMINGDESIDIARISPTALTSHGGEKSKLLALPYVFSSHEHFWNFASSELADEIMAEPAEKGKGIRGLFYGEEGFRHFFSNEDVNGIEDFAGMRIRVSNDPIMNGMVQSLGGTPMVVSFNELYIALQNDLVDAAEQPLINYKSNAFPEVASTLILDGHTLGTMEVIISDATWNMLSDTQRAWLEEAGDYAASHNRRIVEEEDKAALEELRAEGVKIVEVKDITPWRRACELVIEEHIVGLETLYQQILQMK